MHIRIGISALFLLFVGFCTACLAYPLDTHCEPMSQFMGGVPAEQVRIYGSATVKIQILVSESGVAKLVKVVECRNPRYLDVFKSAIEKWKFRPASHEYKTICELFECTVIITVEDGISVSKFIYI